MPSARPRLHNVHDIGFFTKNAFRTRTSGPGQTEKNSSGLPLKADIPRYSRHVSKVPEPEVARFLAVSFAKGTHERHLSTRRPALFAARRCSPREQPTA